MAKNIIICSDGTGNTAIKGRGTNVFKMFESVDLNSHRFHPDRTPQVAIYDDGVGTDSMKLPRILGGAAGYGLSRNVRQLYKELCRIYDPGDQIFLEAAAAARADVLVTKDRELLSLKNRVPFRVARPGELGEA